MCLTDDDARKLMPHLMRTSRSLKLAPLDPEDVVQEALLRMHSHLKTHGKTLSDISRVESWSATIVRSAGTDMLRKRFRLRSQKPVRREVCGMQSTPEVVDKLPHCEEQSQLEECIELFARTLGELGVAAIKLKVQAHTVQEIADQLEVDCAAVAEWLRVARSILSRARKVER